MKTPLKNLLKTTVIISGLMAIIAVASPMQFDMEKSNPVIAHNCDGESDDCDKVADFTIAHNCDGESDDCDKVADFTIAHNCDGESDDCDKA